LDGPRDPRRRFAREDAMDDHIYRIIQIVGSSDKSVDDAIQRAVARASQTLRNLRWFEVVETRGHIEDGKVQHYQVTLKIGFTIADTAEA
jgi:dodecin